jgi:hypothetical protein
MGVDIIGMESIEKEINKKYSRKAIDEAEARALKAGGNMMRNKVATQLYNARDTGQLAIGTDLKEAKKVGNEMIAYIYWRGNHSSLAHLVNNGYHDRAGNFIKPKGYQKVDTTLKINADLYYALLKKELNK